MADHPGTTDTSDDAARVQVSCYRALSGARRLALACELGRLADSLARAGIRVRHPGASDADVHMRLLVLKYGPALVRDAYGWVDDG